VPLICVLLNASVCSALLPPSEAGSVPASCAFSETSRVCSELIHDTLAGIVPDMRLCARKRPVTAWLASQLTHFQVQ